MSKIATAPAQEQPDPLLTLHSYVLSLVSGEQAILDYLGSLPDPGVVLHRLVGLPGLPRRLLAGDPALSVGVELVQGADGRPARQFHVERLTTRHLVELLPWTKDDPTGYHADA